MALGFIKRIFSSVASRIAAIFTRTQADEWVIALLADVWEQYEARIAAILADLWRVNDRAGLHQWRDQAFAAVKAELPQLDNAVLTAAINLIYRKLTRAQQ